jgi:hypothetical protein
VGKGDFMMAKLKKRIDHEKIPAQILVWTIVNTDDITDLSDDCIISMAEMQENWKVARP